MAGSKRAMRSSCSSQNAISSGDSPSIDLAGGVEDVLGPPARRVGGRGLGLHQLEAHHLRVEAVGLGQVADRDGNVVERHAAEHRVPSPSMRARRGLVLGWAGRRAATPPRSSPSRSPPSDGDLPPGRPCRRRRRPPRRSSTRGSGRGSATFVRTGTFERRSEVTGAVDQLRGRARAAAAAAPAPPARRGRRAATTGALIAVPGAPDGRAAEPSAPSASPAGPTYDEDVASEVAALRTLVDGPVPGVRRRAASARAAASTSASCASSHERPFGTEAPVLLRRGHRRAHRTAGCATRAASSRSSPSPDLRGDGRATPTSSPERACTGGRRPRHGSGSLRPRFDAVGGSRNPRPVPVLTSGGDDRRSLGQSTHPATTLSGFRA